MAIARFRWPLVLAAMVPCACNPQPASGPDASTPVADAARADAAPSPDVAQAPLDAPVAEAPDVVTPADAPTPAVDAGAGDADASAVDAGATVAECAPGALIDLNARGTTTDGVTRITIATDGAPATAGLAAPSCQSDVGHPLVFRYTARTTATLRVSTNNPGTMFDTVAWALDRCAASGAMELGCGDDDNAGTLDNASTFLTSDRVMAGQSVYIVVAGMGGGSGPVELTVAELRDVALGGACDATGETTICSPAPASCVTSGGASRCEAPMYAESGVAPPTFVDACAAGGTRVALAANAGADARDDGHSAAGITLPFAFSFFGAPVHAIWPSTNGYAVFDATPTDNAGGDGSIPMPEEGPVVAPFWQNLALRAAPTSDICVRTVGTAPSRQLAVEWLDAMPTGDTSTHVTFELVLSEGSNAVDFVYPTLDPGASPPEESDGTWSVIGMQSNHGERFITHDGSVDTMNGVRFAPATM